MGGTAIADLTGGRRLHSLLWASRRAGEPSAWHGHVAFVHWLVDVLRPRRIVELGTERGVSYAALCHAVAALGIPTPCFAVDTWQGDAHTGAYDDAIYNSVKSFNDAYYGHFSTLLRCTFDEALGRFDDGGIDLLHIDGLHTYEAVRHDFETWAPKVSDAGVILFHDTAVRDYGFGVWQFWSELTARHPSFTFEHSSGLGVLAYGSNVPEGIRRLCAITDPEEVEGAREVFKMFSDMAYASGQRDLEVQALRRKVADMQGVLQRAAGELVAAATA